MLMMTMMMMTSSRDKPSSPLGCTVPHIWAAMLAEKMHWYYLSTIRFKKTSTIPQLLTGETRETAAGMNGQGWWLVAEVSSSTSRYIEWIEIDDDDV